MSVCGYTHPSAAPIEVGGNQMLFELSFQVVGHTLGVLGTKVVTLQMQCVL